MRLAGGRVRAAGPGFVAGAVLLAALAAGAAGCGKKGPPLPPLVRIPAQPGEMLAERRGDTVTVSFVVPGANADRTRPANVDRVEVYAITAPATVSDQDVRRFGEQIAILRVNPPAEPDQPPRTVAGGLDQGARASVTDALDQARRQPVTLPAPAVSARPVVRPGTPLLGPSPSETPARIYMAVPIGGRRVGSAARAIVPLVDTPAPPSRPRIEYDEDALTLTWTPPGGTAVSAAGRAGLLPARPLTGVDGRLAYHVYEVSGDDEGTRTEQRLTTRPADAPRFVDARVEFGAERCYVVRALQRLGTLAIESEAAGETCVQMVDTFPPPAPTGLTTVPTDGAISLIWDPSDAADLAGYVVLRGQPGGALAPVTAAPQRETSFRDTVPSGTRAVYAVQAVDREGNASDASATVEDTAR